MESKLAGPSLKKMTKCLIEKVENGFIVSEDYQIDPKEIPGRSHKQQVFNTKKSLLNYITKTM